MVDDFDLAEDHQEPVQVWRDFCAENNIKTPVSPPASDDGSSEQDEESDKNSASNESGPESEADTPAFAFFAW